MDYSLPGSSVHEIFQARILEWVAISFSKGSSQPSDQTLGSCLLSCIAGRVFTTELPGSWLFSYLLWFLVPFKIPQLSSVQSLSRVPLFAIPWIAACQASQLPEFTQTHVHRVGDAIQPSHPLSSPSPAPNPSQYQSLFQWVNSSHEVVKLLEFQLQNQSFQWIPRTDLL